MKNIDFEIKGVSISYYFLNLDFLFEFCFS